MVSSAPILSRVLHRMSGGRTGRLRNGVTSDRVSGRPRAVVEIAVGSVAAVVAVAGCSAVPAGSGATTSSGLTSLTIATSFAINNLDPLQNGFWGSEMGFGDLLMKPEGPGKLAPWLLAKDPVRTSADVWTLTLRPHIRFQNGHPLTGAALAQTMNYMLANNTELKPTLPGAKVAAAGPLTVTLTTAQPTASVPSILADEAYFDIFDTPVYLKHKANPNSLVAARIYTGPYTPVSITPEEMVSVPNKYYYGPKPKLKKLTILFIASAQARIDAVERGEADLALYPPTAAAHQLQGRSDAYFISLNPRDVDGGFMLYFNLRSAPFDDLAVRQAVQHAINYHQIAAQVMDGYYIDAKGLYPASLPYALDDQQTNVALASQELRADGWKKGSNGIYAKNGQQLSFTVLDYPQQPDLAPISLAMQSELRAAGINMQIRSVQDIDTVIAESTGWQAALDGNSAMDWTDTDPINPLISYYTPKGDENYGGVNDPRMTTIVNELEASESTSETDSLLEQAQKIVVSNAWVVWVSFKRDSVVAAPALRHYKVPAAALLWVNPFS
jgi:peptide/nickel transport system substrate-binding protein